MSLVQLTFFMSYLINPQWLLSLGTYSGCKWLALRTLFMDESMSLGGHGSTILN